MTRNKRRIREGSSMEKKKLFFSITIDGEKNECAFARSLPVRAPSRNAVAAPQTFLGTAAVPWLQGT